MKSSNKLICISEDTWSKFNPEQFENFCSSILKSQNKNYKINRSSYRNDGGIDLILEPNVGINLKKSYIFAHCIHKTARIYAEIKRRKTTGIDDIARTLVSEAIKRNCDYLVIITTAQLNLSTYFQLKNECNINKIRFGYIHNDILTRYLISNKDIAEKFGIANLEKKWNEILSQVVPEMICYWDYRKIISSNKIKTHHSISLNKNITLYKDELISVPIVVENYSDNKRELEVKVSGLGKWNPLRNTHKNWLIESGSVKSNDYRFELYSNTAVKLPEVYFNEKTNDNQSNFEFLISAGNLFVVPYFQIPFIGKTPQSNKYLLECFLDQSNYNIEWLLIEGEARVGKTRLIEETVKGLPELHIKQYSLERNKSFETIKGIINDLKKELINNIALKNEFDTILENIKDDNISKKTLIKIANLFQYQPVFANCFIIIEDIHLASKSFYKLLELLTNFTKKSKDNTFYHICLTGRNDETFPNNFQDSFREYFKTYLDHKNRYLKLLPLSEEDAKTFILSVFHEITDNAIKKILKLSNNIPFNIIQIIEFLTEESCIEIHDRKTYSIKNEGVFFTKIGLPESMEKLIHLRIKNLKSEVNNNDLLLFFNALVIYGFQIPVHHFEELLKHIKKSDQQKISKLFYRGFLKKENDNYIRFTHENLHHFLNKSDKKILGSRKKSAAMIYNSPSLYSSLANWKKCEICFFSGFNKEAISIVNNTIGDGDVTSISHSENLYGSNIILDIGIKLLLKNLKSSIKAQKLLSLYFLKMYVSKFTRNYFKTIENGKTILNDIESNEVFRELIPKEIFDVSIAKVKQIMGHAYQNTGFIEKAYEFSSSALISVLECPNKDLSYLDLKYDIYDRLRKNHILFNDYHEAKKCYKQAVEVAKIKEDNSLIATGEYGEAELFFLQDPLKAKSIWEKIKPNIIKYADRRIQITFELANIQLKLLTNKDEESTINDIIAILQNLGNECLENNFVGPYPKIHLLKAFAFYLLGNYDSCIKENENAYNKAEKTGYGVYLWFAMNNRALALQMKGGKNSIQDSKNSFDTAFEKAEKQGFFKTKLKNDPLFFQTSLIQNISNFNTLHGLISRQKKLLKKINDFENITLNQILEKKVHPFFHVEHGVYFLFI